MPSAIPFGTYGPRVFHNDPVELEPDVDAIVAAPGPTLADVKAELEASAERGTDEPAATQHPIVDAVRDAFTREARALAEDIPMNREGDSKPPGGAADEPAAGDVHVRRRRDRRPKPRAGEARRVVVHRDRRRGRPPKTESPERHGSDPPSEE